MSIARVEDAVSKAEHTLGFSLESGDAADEMRDLIAPTPALRTPEEAAMDFLTEPGRLIQNGPLQNYYSVYRHSDDEGRFMAMRELLKGRIAYMPGPIKDPETQQVTLGICPVAIVPANDQEIRLTIAMKRAILGRTRELVDDSLYVLAGAAQADSPKIGEHNSDRTVSEPGHLLSVMAGALQTERAQRLRQGDHIIHDLKERAINPVVAFTNPKQGEPIIEQTITTRTYSHATWPQRAQLLWPAGAEQPQDLAFPDAVRLIQGDAFMTLEKTGSLATAFSLMEHM